MAKEQKGSSDHETDLFTWSGHKRRMERENSATVRRELALRGKSIFSDCQRIEVFQAFRVIGQKYSMIESFISKLKTMLLTYYFTVQSEKRLVDIDP